MYKIGDIVTYSVSGICKIIDVTSQSLAGENMDYYVLQPVFDNRSTILVPVHNPILSSRMNNVLSKDEAYELIAYFKNTENVWVENDRERKEIYKKHITSGNRKLLIDLIVTLENHRDEVVKVNKKLHSNDERILNDATKVIFNEIAYVLNIERDDVRDYIINYNKTV